MPRVYLNKVFLFRGFSLIAGGSGMYPPLMEGLPVYIPNTINISFFKELKHFSTRTPDSGTAELVNSSPLRQKGVRYLQTIDSGAVG